MVNEEWLEIRARSQHDAVLAAVEELGVSSEDEVTVEVVEEPGKGIFGLGGKDGLFRVARKQKAPRRRRRRGSGSDRTGERREDSGREERRPSKKQQPRSGGGSKHEARTEPRERRPEKQKSEPKRAPQAREEEVADVPDLDEQASVINEFLVGLLDAFGLEGTVETRIEGDDILIANVTGEQTEALVGAKGVILQSILELTRTVVQRKTQSGARIRLDIGGYTERRREALRIYTARLAEQVRADGEEVMLEPMNPADRKVVHDAVGEIDGVRSYSEGEEPSRSVVISPAMEG